MAAASKRRRLPLAAILTTVAAAALSVALLAPRAAFPWPAALSPAPADDTKTIGVRPPAVAGRFYPANAAHLEGAVRAYLEDALPARGARPVAVVAPHAGYIFSGQIAADAYRQAMGHDYDLIVILGTNHTTGGFHGVSIYPGPGYRTPLGLAASDRELAARLTAMDPAFTYEAAVHATEHSVEVQVPFVQVAFPGVKILAAVVGTPDPDLCIRFGKALAKAVKGRKALIVASSDLSHYPAHDDAVATDHAVIEAMATGTPAELHAVTRKELQRGIPGLSTCACGEAPIMAAMQAARELGAGQGVPISYANSGDSAVADRSRVVGYGAVMFVGEAAAGKPASPDSGPAAARAFPPLVSAGPAAGGTPPVPGNENGAKARPDKPSEPSSSDSDAGRPRKPPLTGDDGATAPVDGQSSEEQVASTWLDGDTQPLTKDERRALLEFSRETIQRYLTTETAPLARDYPPALARTQGIFVTLRKEGHNRGCRGNMRPDLPLYQLVGVMSLQSAFNDSRFPTLRLNELDEISLEISLLTPMAPVGGPADVVVGRDGVLLTKDGRSAVYLPEVAVEMGWDRDEMLEHLCHKAGLPAGCWREGARFQTFQADVIKEAAALPH